MLIWIQVQQKVFTECLDFFNNKKDKSANDMSEKNEK